MGLLNNWLHKKKKEQLNRTGAPKSPYGGSPTGRPVEVAVKPVEESKAHTRKENEPKKYKIRLSENSAIFRILVKPLVTEKSAVAESINKYSFVVARSANKNQIKKAVEEIYGVKPAVVNVINMEGRRLRFGRSAGRRSDFKKAIVTLPQGKTIDIHSGV